MLLIWTLFSTYSKLTFKSVDLLFFCLLWNKVFILHRLSHKIFLFLIRWCFFLSKYFRLNISFKVTYYFQLFYIIIILILYKLIWRLISVCNRFVLRKSFVFSCCVSIGFCEEFAKSWLIVFSFSYYYYRLNRRYTRWFQFHFRSVSLQHRFLFLFYQL